MRVEAIDDLPSYFANVRRARAELDKHVLPWQAVMGPGQKFLQFIPEDRLTVYGVIEDPLEHWREPLDEEDRLNKRFEEERWAKPEMKNIRFAKCFSSRCPKGEYGHIHVATIFSPISDEVFNDMKEIGFPPFWRT